MRQRRRMRMRRRRSKRNVQEDNKEESILTDDEKVAADATTAAVATVDVADLDGFFVACDGLFGLEHVLVRVPHVANTTQTHTEQMRAA
jgi:hypothetical protein